MAFNLCRLVFVYLFLGQLSLFVSSSRYIKPKILSQYETILESGQNYTVVCQGNAPLKWQWPEMYYDTQEYKNWTTITTKDVLPINGTYTHGSRLFIQNATFPFTGFYRCYSDGINPFDDEFTASVYIYVRDEEHLSVKNSLVDSVIVTQFTDAIIPCRPTSPDVDVQLTLITGEKSFLGTLDEEGVMYRYHPHYGFLTNKTKQAETVMYECIFTRNGSFTTTVILDIQPIRHGVAKPILEEISGGHTVVGEKLVLECRVKTQTFVETKWITPTGDPDLQRMNISSQWKDHDQSLTIQRLTINEAILKDKGTYYCNVSDMQNHFSISSLNVTIYDRGHHFINLTEENNATTIPAAGQRQKDLIVGVKKVD